VPQVNGGWEKLLSDWRITLRNALLLVLLAAPLGIGAAVALYVLLPPDSVQVLAVLPVCGLVLLGPPLIWALRKR
jgi:hypothetical protein